MENYKSMPKVELHLHLDGSIRVETAAELLNKNIEDVKKEMIADEKCLNLNDYLTKFNVPSKIMQTKENLERIAYELALDLKKDNVIYAEIRFAPLKHTKKGLTGVEVIESILKGLAKVDIKTNLILCMMRGVDEITNLEVIDLAKKFLNKGVVAIDLAGAEALYKTLNYQNLFEYAKDKKIPFTIHAGEADGKQSIQAAINFGAKRLGHGVKSLDHQELIEEIKEKDILLEVCPTSNIQTNIVDSIKKHQIRKLYDLGVAVSINTDNRTVSNVSLTKEYENLNKYLSFKYEDFVKMNITAINHAFLSEKEKKELLIKLNNK